MSSALKAGLPPSNAPVKPILPPMRYAAAAGGSANPAPSPITTNGSFAAAAVTSPLSTTTAGPPVPSSSASSIQPHTPGSTAPSLPPQGKSASVSASSPPASPSAASMSISASSPVTSSVAPLSYALDASSVADSNLHDSPAQSPLTGSQGTSSRKRLSSVDPFRQLADLSPLIQSMAHTSLGSADGRVRTTISLVVLPHRINRHCTWIPRPWPTVRAKRYPSLRLHHQVWLLRHRKRTQTVPR